ncbi:MAG TPA: hypothetical protein VKU91_10435 [Acidimicrobiales bacterium]|nr:hypothetical protein [Acidimicrobiales bacterium]
MRPSLAATAGLVGGFAVARRTGRRELGGAAFAGAGLLCARSWYRQGGWPAAVGLGALYASAMGASHPVAKKIGAWPAVLVVSAAVAAASEVTQARAARR